MQGLMLSLLVSALVICAVALPSARLSPLSPLPSLAEVAANSGAGAVGTVCAVKNRRGSCQDSKTTACDGFYESTPICGSGTIQCCVDDLLCRTDKGEPGRCMDVQNPADPTANFVNLICHTKQEAKPGMCPGLRAFVQCCIGAPSCEEFSNTTASVAAFIESQEELAVVSDEAELERRFDAQLDFFTSDLASHRIVHQSARARVLDRSRPVSLPSFVEERSGSLAELGAVAHLTVPERQVQGLLKWLRQRGVRSEFVSAGHFGEEHQRLLANDMRFRQELQEAIPPVTPPVEAEIVNERIDVRAQFALQRLFKRGGKDKQDAIELFNSVRFSYKLKGIYGDDLGQVAKIAKQRKTVRWELVPKGEKGVILTDTVDENTPVLIFKESAGKQPDLDNLLLELYRAHRDLLSPVPTATGPACPPDATFFDDFRPYLCIDRFVQSRLKNPKLKKVAVRSTIGKSFLGKPIPVVTLNPSGKANTPAVLLTGGHHAREWLAISSLLKVFDTLVSHLIDPKDDELKKIFAKVQFIIVPVVNPDGYEYTWPPPLRSKPTEKTFMCDRRWRKNRSRRPVTGTCVGTDLNRNYNEHWCSNVKKPISPVQDACFDTFCGISPASEPETRAMQSLIDSRSQLRAMIDFHTFDQKVLFSFGHTPGVTISAASVAAAKLAAAKMTAAAGNPFPYEATQPGDGKAPGGGIDYFAAKMQARSIANEFSYAFELRPSRNEADPKSKFGFIVPPSEIAPTAVEALAGFKSIVQSLIATLP